MSEIDVSRMEFDLSNIIKIDRTVLAVNRVMSTIGKFEIFLDENMLRDPLALSWILYLDFDRRTQPGRLKG